MSVVVSLVGAGPSQICVGASPLAELTAALHAYTEAERHPRMMRWARGLEASPPEGASRPDKAQSSATLTPDLQRLVRAWAPLWASYRARYLLPLSTQRDRSLDAELADIAALPLDAFAELTGYAVRGGITGTSLDKVLHDCQQRKGLLAATEIRSTVRAELARRLVDDPEGMRSDLLRMLATAAAGLEPDLNHAARTIAAQLPQLRSAVERDGPGQVLAALDSSATYRHDPERVVFDKLHHGIVNAATTPVLLIPSVFGRPHLLVKHEPGYAAVIQYPVLPEGDEQPGYATVNRRLEALRDPGRQRIARAIAREPLTPSELADRSGMSLPQVSRHLARLREVGLVTIERDGRRSYYSLNVDRMRRIGDDLLAALLH